MSRRLLLLAAALAAVPGCGPSPPSPATAPAPVSTAPIRFEDVTAGAGIRFRHETGADGRFLMPESVGPGCAFLDYDGDGWLDVFLVNGTGWPDRPPRRATGALYRNQRDGTFRDVTREAGLAVTCFGMGCSAGDYDGDGDVDLLVTCLGPNRLFRNDGGRFRDVTRGSGLEHAGPMDWHTSAAWLDYDRDGRLDLFQCRYVKWSAETAPVCRSASGRMTYCGPRGHPANRSVLYRNLGGGRFQDVSARMGLSKLDGKALGVVSLDQNEDGWCDLFIANDQVANSLLVNLQGRRFEEQAHESGVAVGDSGQARAGMGIDAADVWNDGGVAFAIGNFSEEGLALFGRRDTIYVDNARTAGLVPASLPRLTFGLLFLDADQDGWQDLFAFNGHVDPAIDEQGGPVTYREPPQLFRNERGRFRDVTGEAGAALQKPYLGRGCAWGDYDNDGRPDLLLSENGGAAHLLRNVTESTHRWLGVRLQAADGNATPYGAEVRLTAGGITQRRWVRSGGSYLSQSDTRALFGLGASAAAERLEVRWPSGARTIRASPPLDRYLELVEPAGTAARG